MKLHHIILLAGIMLVCVVFRASAQEFAPGPAYISDTIKVTLRAGQGMDHKIVSLLTVGQKIEILEPGEEWTRIRAANNKEGWILSSFISKKPPTSMTLKQTQSNLEELSERCASLEAEKNQMAAENASLKEQLSADTEKNSTRIEELARENRILRDSLGNRFIKWFLAGGGVLLLGFFLGYQSKRDRQRLY
ncbi:MAG: TIGR04211 family SH3 domain-containing protein [Thermodesulfobacteriota bacterium]